MGKARVVIAGSAALLAVGFGTAHAQGGSAPAPKAVPACNLAGVGFTCTVNVPGVVAGSGALGVVTTNGAGLAGTMAGTAAGMPGNLSGDLQVGHDGNLLSGALVGALGNLINGHLEGSLNMADGHLCGTLNLLGAEVISGGLLHSSGANPVYAGGLSILGVPGGLMIAPQSGGAPIQFIPVPPCK
jgi:hypothetical protein